MSDYLEKDYDEYRYGSVPNHFSHPERSAVIARLLGIEAPPPATARILELGCNDGANLLPMALGYPDASLLGVDISGRAIGDANRVAEAVGLRNIEFRQGDVGEMPVELGEFDYVLATGLHPALTPALQQRLLEICAANLSRSGILYISVATYPAGHVMALARDILRYHTRTLKEPQDKVREARRLIEFLRGNIYAQDKTYANYFSSFLNGLTTREDGHLYHEYLAEVHTPVYFYQFAEQAQSLGLEYISEARLRERMSGVVSPETETALDAISQDFLHQEQYRDILANRGLRSCLLTKGPIAQRSWDLGAVKTMYCGTLARPTGPAGDLAAPAPVGFKGPDSAIEISDPVAKTALVVLAESWPECIPYATLVAKIKTRLPAAGERIDAALPEILVRCFAIDILQLHLYPPRLSLAVSERPCASALARYAVETGMDKVPTLYHRLTKIDPIAASLLRHLDGSRDHGDLLEVVSGMESEGLFEKTVLARQSFEGKTLEQVNRERLDRILDTLRKAALLVA